MEAHTRKMFRKIFRILMPPPDLTLSEWADTYRKLSGESSATPGKWRTKNAPYQKEIMDAITDIEIRKVVIMSAAQIGKTEAMILNTLGYYIHYDPSPIMVIQPTIKMGEKFSKEKFLPMIRDNPIIEERINENSRTSGNTIMQKSFPGGFVTIAGANSPTELRSHTVRIILADEIDGYPASAGKEGDPLMLAAKRQTTFWNKKLVCISTPTIKGASRIELEYQNSSRGEWNTPCPCCGKLQPLIWANVVYDKEDLSEIRYVCRECGTISSEAEWKAHLAEGKFVHEDPANKTKGFHLNTLASTLVAWEEMIEKYLLAEEEMEKGNTQKMQVWVNTEMGEVWEEDSETLEEQELMERQEYYNCEVPEDVLYLTAGVDTQDDRFEIEVVGWGPEYESWGIKYAKIYGNNSNMEDPIWEKLDLFLSQTFRKEDGTMLKIVATCIDVGGHRGNQVHKFCKPRFSRGVFAIQGSNNSASAYIQNPTKSNREKAYLFRIGVDTGKSWLMDRLKVKNPGPGYCHFPAEEEKGYDEQYFIGLTAEKKTMKTNKEGFPVYKWELKDQGKHRRNEPFDCRNYATAAIEITKLPLKKPDEEKKTTTRRKKRRGKRSGGIA